MGAHGRRSHAEHFERHAAWEREFCKTIKKINVFFPNVFRRRVSKEFSRASTTTTKAGISKPKSWKTTNQGKGIIMYLKMPFLQFAT